MSFWYIYKTKAKTVDTILKFTIIIVYRTLSSIFSIFGNISIFGRAYLQQIKATSF